MINSKSISRLIGLFLFIFLSSTYAQAKLSEQQIIQIKQRVTFTEEEKNWLLEHPSIKLGIDADYAPYSFIENGKYRGLSLEYLTVFSAVTGVELDIVPELSWQQIIDGVKNKELDIIATALKTKERQAFANFSNFFIPTPLVIMSNSGDAKQLSSVRQLAGKKVSVVKNYAATKQLLFEQPNLIPEYFVTPKDAMQALALGKVDAYVGVLGVNTHLARKHGWTNVVVAGGYDLTGNKQRFAANIDQQVLIQILDKVLSLIPQQVENQLINKWLPITSTDVAPQSLIELSKHERRYLELRDEIRFCFSNRLGTYSYMTKSGKHSGILADYLNTIENSLNTKFVASLFTDRVDIKGYLHQDLCDLGFYFDEQQEVNDLALSEPFFSILSVIVTHDSQPYVEGLEEFEGLKIGVVEGSPSYFVLSKQQQAQAELFNNEREMLIALSDRRVEVGVAPLYSITNSIEQFGFSRLKVAGQIAQKSPIRFISVVNNQPLISAINKAVSHIDVSEKNRIANKWTQVKFEQSGVDLTFILKMGLLISLLFLFLLYRHRSSLIHSKNLAKANRSLKQAKREAERANKAKSDFLANMSHEVRTPMNGLMAAVELLKNSSLSAIQRGWVEAIERNGLVQISLLNEILDVTKTESGQLSVNISPCDLTEVLESLVLSVQYRAEQKSIRLKLHNPLPKPLMVLTDANIIRQVLLNLIENAIKYSGADKITIAVKVLSSSEGQWHLVFSVADKGVGISEREQKLVFNSFYQGEEQEQRLLGTQRGVGLGLSICQSLLALLSSSLQLKSKVGRGCTFSFELGLKEVAAQQAAQESQVEEVLQELNLNILLVDDDLVNADLVASVLTSQGHCIKVANTGLQAIDLTQHNDFDLVLMDIWLPDISGIEAMQQIKHLSSKRVKYVVAFTASLLSEDKASYFDQGMDDILPKPFQLQNFNTMLIQLFFPEAKAQLTLLKSTTLLSTDIGQKAVKKANEKCSVDFVLALDNCEQNQHTLNFIAAKFVSLYQELVLTELEAEPLAKLCHKLTTGASIVGAVVLSQLAKDLSRVEQATNASLQQRLQLQTELACVVDELSDYVASNQES